MPIIAFLTAQVNQLTIMNPSSLPEMEKNGAKQWQ